MSLEAPTHKIEFDESVSLEDREVFIFLSSNLSMEQLRLLQEQGRAEVIDPVNDIVDLDQDCSPAERAQRLKLISAVILIEESAIRRHDRNLTAEKIKQIFSTGWQVVAVAANAD